MKSSTKTKLNKIAIAYSFVLPTLLLMAVFNFYPMIHAFILSTWQYFPNSPKNEFVGMANFVELWHDRAFWEALTNSILYLLVVPAMIVCSLTLAILVEPRIPFVNFFRACYYVPVVTMTVVVAYAWSLLFNTDTGLINDLLSRVGFTHLLVRVGVLSEPAIPWLTSEKTALWTTMTVTMWKGLGYYMIIFIVGLKAIPKELVEAAKIDGANGLQKFLFVTVPCLWPTISLCAILSSISALQVFEEIYMLTSGRIGTATLVYEIYRTGFDLQAGGSLQMGYACAMGVVLFGILFIFTAISIRTMERAYQT